MSHTGELLAGSSARVILARLLDGDPLELSARCEEQMREGGWLLNLPRLSLRAAALTAYRACKYSGEPEIALWLAQNISDSIQDLLAEEQETVRNELPPEEPVDPRVAALAGVLGMEPTTFFRSVARYHGLPTPVRKAFFAIVVDGIALKTYADEEALSVQDTETFLTLALEALVGSRRNGNGR